MRKFIPIAALLVAACQQAPADQSQSNDASAVPAAPAETATPEGTAPAPSPPENAPARVPAPAPETAPFPGPTPDADKSAAAATRVLESYFAAVATKHYRLAYRMWSGNGAATGMSEAEFAASFAKYRVYDGNPGKPGLTDGAAGSIYIEIPVKVTGVLARGGGFVLEGTMTLKRVNDVDGSLGQWAPGPPRSSRPSPGHPRTQPGPSSDQPAAAPTPTSRPHHHSEQRACNNAEITETFR